MQKINQDVGIGRNIRKLRLKQNMKQVDVVAKLQVMGCKISRTTYVKIERETHNLRVSDLVALKNALDVRSYDEFFYGLDVDLDVP